MTIPALPARPVPMPMLWPWIFLMLGVGTASLWSNGPEHYIAPLMILNGAAIVGACLVRSKGLVVIGLAWTAVLVICRVVLVWYGDRYLGWQKVNATVIWTVISTWALLMARAASIAGVMWRPDPQ